MLLLFLRGPRGEGLPHGGRGHVWGPGLGLEQQLLLLLLLLPLRVRVGGFRGSGRDEEARRGLHEARWGLGVGLRGVVVQGRLLLVSRLRLRLGLVEQLEEARLLMLSMLLREPSQRVRKLLLRRRDGALRGTIHLGMLEATLEVRRSPYSSRAPAAVRVVHAVTPQVQQQTTISVAAGVAGPVCSSLTGYALAKQSHKAAFLHSRHLHRARTELLRMEVRTWCGKNRWRVSTR